MLGWKLREVMIADHIDYVAVVRQKATQVF
jgi:hypothetical protein